MTQKFDENELEPKEVTFDPPIPDDKTIMYSTKAVQQKHKMPLEITLFDASPDLKPVCGPLVVKAEYVIETDKYVAAVFIYQPLRVSAEGQKSDAEQSCENIMRYLQKMGIPAVRG